MATAQSYVKRALIKAGIRTAESPLESDEIQDGLEQLNDFMAAIEPELHLGFVPLENATDEVNIPRHARAYVKAALAVYFCSEYGRQAPQTLTTEAANMHASLLNTIVTIPEVQYPSTLPLGSGNVDSDYDVFDHRFYPAVNESNF